MPARPDAARSSRTRLVAIHQPNFLPWLGYFDKLARADVFVLLDTVQFPKSGGTWMNRVRLGVGAEPAWITVPVVRAYSGRRRVNEIRIDERRPWRARMLRTIEQSYAWAPFFDEVMPLVRRLLMIDTDVIADFNESGIRILASSLGLDQRKITRSSLYGTSGSSTDLLIELTRAVGGTAYLSGAGADGYQDPDKFARSGVELVRQEFDHPTYPHRFNPAVPGLSVVDALMACGFAGANALLCGDPGRAARSPEIRSRAGA